MKEVDAAWLKSHTGKFSGIVATVDSISSTVAKITNDGVNTSGFLITADGETFSSKYVGTDGEEHTASLQIATKVPVDASDLTKGYKLSSAIKLMAEQIDFVTDGFTIKNNSNELMLSVDNTGNMKIGDFSISGGGLLYSVDSKTLTLNPDGFNFAAGSLQTLQILNFNSSLQPEILKACLNVVDNTPGTSSRADSAYRCAIHAKSNSAAIIAEGDVYLDGYTSLGENVVLISSGSYTLPGAEKGRVIFVRGTTSSVVVYGNILVGINQNSDFRSNVTINGADMGVFMCNGSYWTWNCMST
jgi:hypothetical protein